MKIRRVGAELFHADGQTDMTKLMVAFRNFTKALSEMSVPIFLGGRMSVVHLVASHCTD